MRPDDPFSLAAQALRQKERSRSELGAWLRKRGFDEAEVEDTLLHLEEIGELDDARFARRYAEDKRELRGWGAERIREALAARGVGSAEIEAVISDAGEDELTRAVDLLARRGDQLDSDAARNRALAFLTRRGYPYELAYEAIHAIEREAA
jgi:regulatory protein